jgi:hypothetical protein
LLAAVRTGPALTFTAVTADDGYVRVHCESAGELPPLKETARDAVPPVVTELEDSDREPDCATSKLPQDRHKKKAIRKVGMKFLDIMGLRPPWTQLKY